MLHDETVIRFPSGATLAGLPGLGWMSRRLATGLQGSLGRIGSLEVRLATRKKEIRKAQRIRYKTFYQEGHAVPDPATALTRRDRCHFDRFCDHLLVIDHAAVNKLGRRRPKVVGTYRLLRQDVAQQHRGFYSAQEFDLGPLLAQHPTSRFLEVGRSCVLPPYRSKRTIELLWRGIYAYVRHYRIDALIGCASLEGTDPGALALPLSFLHHHAGAGADWKARALASRYVDMAMLPREAVDVRRAMTALPPLLKGYLRAGALFGEGAVVDHQFGTTDVLVILPVARIEARYSAFFGGERDGGLERQAA